MRSFPAKPREEIRQQSLSKSLISLALFIGAFYLFFRWEVSYILVLVGVIFVHELGHYLAMKFFRYKDLSIFFIPLIGAFTSGVKDAVSQKQNIIILFAGPIPGIIVGLILYYYGLSFETEFLTKSANIFIIINIFNLLPIMPLDGGKIIKSLFFNSSDIINTAFIILSITVLTYISLSSHSYLLLIIPLYLILQLNSQLQIKKTKDEIIKKGINTNKSFDELTNEEYWMIRDAIISHVSYFNRFASHKKYVVSEKEPQIIKQIKNIVQRKPTSDLNVGVKILITIFWILIFIIPVILITVYTLKFN